MGHTIHAHEHTPYMRRERSSRKGNFGRKCKKGQFGLNFSRRPLYIMVFVFKP